MIYIHNRNIPLNEAYDDEIVQEANSTYQLSFKFPVNDSKWMLLKEETVLLADDLHGEQLFVVFEVEREHGAIKVYANQIATLLNYYSIREVSVNRSGAMMAMSALASSFVRDSPFSFYSDISSPHTLNVKNCSAMDVLAKGKHSIVGEWGGDLIRDRFSVRLLKEGGSENESLFMYKKNMKSYKQSLSIKSLCTRIHLHKTIKGEDGAPDTVISATVDSPLLSAYQEIYEADIDVSEDEVKDVAGLVAYGQRYFQSALCDLAEESIEIDVLSASDVSVRMFDVVSIYYEDYGVDIRKKITQYHYAPMSKKLKKIGFGKFSSSLGQAISSMVSEEVSGRGIPTTDEIEAIIAKRLANADKDFDRQFDSKKQELLDAIEKSKALSEEDKAQLASEIEAKLSQANLTSEKLKSEFDQWLTEPLSAIKNRLDETEASARINSELIGGDGQTRYNKNRVAGETERSIELGTDYITVGHNGQGFEVGKPYTLSWKAVCVSYGHRDVTVRLNIPWFTTGTIEMVPVDTRFPTITHNAVAKSSIVPMVYYGSYQTNVFGNWIATKTVSADIQDNQNVVEVPLVYKAVVDGNLTHADETVWADNPTIIIDGNGVN